MTDLAQREVDVLELVAEGLSDKISPPVLTSL